MAMVNGKTKEKRIDIFGSVKVLYILKETSPIRMVHNRHSKFFVRSLCPSETTMPKDVLRDVASFPLPLPLPLPTHKVARVEEEEAVI